MNEFRRLWGYFWRYRLRFFASGFCSLVVALVTTAFTTLFIPLYQDVLSRGEGGLPDVPIERALGEPGSRGEDILPLERALEGLPGGAAGGGSLPSEEGGGAIQGPGADGPAGGPAGGGAAPGAAEIGSADEAPPGIPDKEHVISLLRRWLPLGDLLSLGRDRAFFEVPLFCILLVLLKGIFSYLGTYLMDYIGLRVILDLRRELYRKITHQAMSFFSSHQTGELMSRVTNDINRLQNTSARQMSEMFQYALILVGQVFLMVYYDWRLSLICGVILPIVVYPVIRFGRRMKQVSRKSQERMAEVADRLHETISGARVVTGFNMQEHEVGRFTEALRRMFRVDVKGIRVLALSPPVMELLGVCGGAVLIWYAGRRIRGGGLDPAVLMTFLTAMGLTYVILKRLGRINNDLQQALAAARRVFSVLDQEVAVGDRPGARPCAGFEREIRFRHVSFAYDERPVLEDIDFVVRRGEVAALVGSSGAGKSTLVNLLPRFFDVSGGAIELDGTDIRDLTAASLRQRIALVTQEIILFNETVRDNIAYGRQDAPPEAVERAARAALAHDFILRLPQGYQTVIGERGHFLSVGQRQRVAIARALLKDSPILILDEATSALDAESESLVQEALANLMHGRTVLVIAHRLSTIRQARMILVLEGGRIVERGTHEELLRARGVYAKLHNLQFRDPAPAPAGKALRVPAAGTGE